MSFWAEIKRRNVGKVGVAYLIVAWLIAQIIDVVDKPLKLPEWFGTSIIVLLVIGFPLALLFAWIFELTPQGIKKTGHVPLEESIAQLTGQRLNYIVTGLLCLAVAYLAFDNYVLDRGRAPAVAATVASTPTASPSQGPPEPSRPQAVPNSIAVLPLENLSPDPANAYVAAGLHEEILNQLAKLSKLHVIARTSVMQYGGETRPPIADIARTLNVRTVMEGSIRYAGDRIRVTTQLIDAATGTHLWSETYDREFADVFAIESDIAMSVANALAAEFTPQEQQRIERRPTSSAAAYALFLQAISSFAGAGQATQRLEILDRAIAIDPNFSAAYGAKAFTYSLQLVNSADGSARTWNELEPKVIEAANKALALDPENRFPHNSLGSVAAYSWRWHEADEAFRRAHAINNGWNTVPIWLAAWAGDPQAAIERAKQQLARNPTQWIPHWQYGIVLNYSGDYTAAAAKMRDAVRIQRTVPQVHVWLANTEAARGNRDEARNELQISEQLLGAARPVLFLLDLAYGYSRIGDRENADRLYAEINAQVAKGQELGEGGRALMQLAGGHVDEALAALRRGAEKAARHEPDAGFFSLMNLKLNFTNDPVLQRPEFVAVRKQLAGN